MRTTRVANSPHRGDSINDSILYTISEEPYSMTAPSDTTLSMSVSRESFTAPSVIDSSMSASQESLTAPSVIASSMAAPRESFMSPRAPPIPPRASNRPSHTHLGVGSLSALNVKSPPPAYEYAPYEFDAEGVEGPNGEKLDEVRKAARTKESKPFVERGGWKRLALIALVIIVCTVGLVVGLVAGLENQHSNSYVLVSPEEIMTHVNRSNNNDENTSPEGGATGNVSTGSTNPDSSPEFPAGSYSITTYLSTIATNCTSNPATWNCYPYSTYAQSPSSAATFDWIINPDSKNSSIYLISSTSDPFSIMFTNASLMLQDPTLDSEHYFFQTLIQKPTIPSVLLTSADVASTCYFNNTMFKAYLYTKMAKTYPESGSGNAGGVYGEWPFAVKVEQVATSGIGTPSCLDVHGDSVGDFSVPTSGELCDCLYLNTGT
ncbi:hypothetical protein B7494_g898 [Chlorociboria aeruginascens]|nr:hypothetical protein B7494_g898 [Chlorociboria aeruginascens]